MGGVTGSADIWRLQMRTNAGMQSRALAAVLEASQVIDELHSTHIVDAFFDNLLGKYYDAFP
jgi:hypothetical protein